MNSNLFVILFLLFWMNIKKVEAAEEFHVVSTTENPSADFTSKEYNNRIEILELQNFKLQKNLLEQETKLEVLSKIQKKLEEQETKLQDLSKIQIKLEEQETKLQDLSKIQKKLEEQVTKLQDLSKIQIKLEEQETKLQDLSKIQIKLEEQETKLQHPVKFHDSKEDCTDAQREGSTVTGVYKILPKHASQPFEVVCDMDLRGGGWTYVLKRFDGSQDFDLGFSEYKSGFGELSGEFFVGLEHLYQLAGHDDCELLIELSDWEGKVVHAHYRNFSVGSAEEGYDLKVLSGYSGDAGDAIGPHVGVKFSTKDHMVQKHLYCDNEDNFVEGAWWDINGCVRSQLFGRYYRSNSELFPVRLGTGIHWYTFHKFTYSLKTAKMLVRC